MSVQEHSVITFLKAHGQEIVDRERYKYEPIRQAEIQEHSVITFLKTRGKEILDREKYKYEPIRKAETPIRNEPIHEETPIRKDDNELIKTLQQQKQKIEELEQENKRLKSHNNTGDWLETTMEWLDKYKFYKHQYKITKKELQQTKIELVNTQEELVQVKLEVSELRQELTILKLAFSKLKEKRKVKRESSSKTAKLIHSSDRSKTAKIIQTKIENSTDFDSSTKEIKMFSYLEEEIKEEANIITENKEIITAVGNMNAIIKDEPECEIDDKQSYQSVGDEHSYHALEIETETDNIINEDANNYPIEEINPKLKLVTQVRNIPIGQQNKIQDFRESVTQDINSNEYFLDLDNVYDKKDNSLLFGCDDKDHSYYDRHRKNKKKRQSVQQYKEHSYYDRHRKYKKKQQSVKQYNHYDRNPTRKHRHKYNRPYKPYVRRKRFKNTPENRNRFKFKRKFSNRKEIRPLEESANNCPQLKQKIKDIGKPTFIMNLEYIKADNSKWYDYDIFYISDTEPD